ncbi:MAG TPA: hypothetical protein VF600_10060 [Abditibacteriaceae bacterium]|jgi:hypothetical protein
MRRIENFAQIVFTGAISAAEVTEFCIIVNTYFVPGLFNPLAEWFFPLTVVIGAAVGIAAAAHLSRLRIAPQQRGQLFWAWCAATFLGIFSSLWLAAVLGYGGADPDAKLLVPTIYFVQLAGVLIFIRLQLIPRQGLINRNDTKD